MSVKHKNRHLEVFGSENVKGWCHFREQHMTDDHYKLLFKLNQPRIRATRIMGGGYVKLKATPSGSEPYVVFASHFYVLPDERSIPHYRIYVMAPDKQHAILAHYEKRRINSSKLCHDGELCMLVASSNLTLVFKEGMGGSFILATPAQCKVALASDYRLELWTKDHSCAWPLKYEIADDLMFVKNAEEYYAKIHARYANLFSDAPVAPHSSLKQLDSPAHGYTQFRVEDEVVGCTPKGEAISRKLIKYELLSFNQYSSNHPYPNPVAAYPELKALQVCYRKGDATEPTFTSRETCHATMREELDVYGSTLQLRGLCRDERQIPWCYYFVNREKTYLLFIPSFFNTTII